MTAAADKSISRGFSADMSADAILKRLKIVDELYQLGKLFAKAQFVGKVEELQRANRSLAPNVGKPRLRSTSL